jgi:hypothetical protein
MTTVDHVKKYKGKDGIYVGRPTIFGNPFVIGKDGTRAEVMEKYREYVLSRPDILKLIPMLKNRVILCHCRPAFQCHGDVLAELADREENEES